MPDQGYEIQRATAVYLSMKNTEPTAGHVDEHLRTTTRSSTSTNRLELVWGAVTRILDRWTRRKNLRNHPKSAAGDRFATHIPQMTTPQSPHVQNPAVVIGSLQISETASKLVARIVVVAMLTTGGIFVLALLKFGSAAVYTAAPILLGAAALLIAALERWRPRPPP